MAKKVEIANLAVGFLALLVSIGGTAYTIQSGWGSILVGKNDRFYCALQTSEAHEDRVWTVMYRYGKNAKPWLKIASTLGDDWPPQRRCKDIAHRLDIYRQDGLTQLTYREDPATPKQYVICAKTKLSGASCPLLITLKPNVNPYETLRAMTSALSLESSSSVYQGSEESPVSKPSTPFLVIDLEKHLRNEDRLLSNN